MEDASPAELFEAKGEELWKTRRGPKNASLEQSNKHTASSFGK